jgi:cation diffusion facilitator family transporter
MMWDTFSALPTIIFTNRKNAIPVMKSRSFIYISLGVDIIVAASKFIAAAITGSSAMLSEGIHSGIDAFSQILLLWGIKTSNRQADELRPFGYGRELYFWSFIVSLVIFILGGCISFYEGILRFNRPGFSGSQVWNYSILAIAFLFNSFSLYTALKVFNKQRNNLRFWQAILQSKDPTTIIILLGDVGDLICLFIAFLGVFLGRLLHNPLYDGVSSMIIGIILITISWLLVRQSKSLLMGVPPNKKAIRKIIKLTEADPAVIKVKRQFSMYLAPEEVILQLNTVFKEDLDTLQITAAIRRITKVIQLEFPRIKQLFIEPVDN